VLRTDLGRSVALFEPRVSTEKHNWSLSLSSVAEIRAKNRSFAVEPPDTREHTQQTATAGVTYFKPYRSRMRNLETHTSRSSQSAVTRLTASETGSCSPSERTSDAEELAVLSVVFRAYSFTLQLCASTVPKSTLSLAPSEPSEMTL